MKIPLDKLSLWLLPYLYLISVAYYLGYWNTFGVDVFNYYGIEDLIKGVTAPLMPTLLVSLVFAFSQPFFTRGIDFLKKYATWLFFALVGLYFLLSWLGYIDPTGSSSSTPESIVRGEFEGVLLTTMILCFVASALVSWVVRPMELGNWQQDFYTAGVFFILFLPCTSYIAGRMDARYIDQNLAYDYVPPTSGNKYITWYKYLGKAGDYHFFLSPDNLTRTFIASDKLELLELTTYRFNDSISVSRWKTWHASMPTDSSVQIAPPAQLIRP